MANGDNPNTFIEYGGTGAHPWDFRKREKPKKTWCGRVLTRQRVHHWKASDVQRVFDRTWQSVQDGEEKPDWLAELLLKLMNIFDENNPFIQWWPPKMKDLFHVVRRATAEILAKMIRDSFFEPVQLILDTITSLAAIGGITLEIKEIEENASESFR